MQRVPMTPAGQTKMRGDLRKAKEEERPRVLAELEAAREHGDLSENAEYHAAKEKLGFIDGQIRAMEDWLGRAEVIDPTTLSGNRVVFGAIVTFEDLDTEQERTYQIVGPHESDPKKGLISIQSPIARALIGKEEGDEATINTPGGRRNVEIVGVRFA